MPVDKFNNICNLTFNSLSHRSRSDLTIDSLTESQVGSVTGSESGLLGSVSSLNDTHETNDDTETEQQDDYTPVPGKIVINILTFKLLLLIRARNY